MCGMMTAISLVSIHHLIDTIKRERKEKHFFLEDLLGLTLTTYTPYSTVNYSHHAVY